MPPIRSGQRRRRRRDDPARRRVRQRLEHDQRPVAPRPSTSPVVPTAAHPVAPERLGLRERLLRVDRASAAGRATGTTSATNGTRSPFAHDELRDGASSLVRCSSTGVTSMSASGPPTASSVPSSSLPHPRHDRAVVEADDELGAHLDAPLEPLDDPHEVGSAVAQRHEVDHAHAARRRLPLALEDQRVGPVAARRRRPALGGREQPAPVLASSRAAPPKHEPESKRGRHSQSIEPVRPTSAAVCRSPMQRVVLDPLGMRPTYRSAVLELERETVAQPLRRRLGRTRAGRRRRRASSSVCGDSGRAGRPAAPCPSRTRRRSRRTAPRPRRGRRRSTAAKRSATSASITSACSATKSRAAAGSRRRTACGGTITTAPGRARGAARRRRPRSAPRAPARRRRARPRARSASRAATRTASVERRRRRPRARRGRRRNARTGSPSPRDVVDDRRHARAECLQQRTRLVELGPVREDGNRRLRRARGRARSGGR